MKMNGKLPNTHTVPGTKYKKTVQLFDMFAMNECEYMTFATSICLYVRLTQKLLQLFS